MSQPFHVLSVDGGGFRGLFAAHLLKKMEQAWGIDWTRQFGLMAGTSTGAILTAGLAAGISAADLTDFYKVHGKTIFRAATTVSSGHLTAIREQVFDQQAEDSAGESIPRKDSGRHSRSADLALRRHR